MSDVGSRKTTQTGMNDFLRTKGIQLSGPYIRRRWRCIWGSSLDRIPELLSRTKDGNRRILQYMTFSVFDLFFFLTPGFFWTKLKFDTDRGVVGVGIRVKVRVRVRVMNIMNSV